MENASKALIMAGGVLIALMILGALILMFNNLSNYQGTDIQNTREAQILEFNNQYETYNRDDVRGSDVYSLLNKVVDYNERKSSAGVEGVDIQFEPMEVKIDLGDLNNYQYDNVKRLFKTGTYTISTNENTFENAILDEIVRIEKKYTIGSLKKIMLGITKIFVDNRSTDSEKNEAVRLYNTYVSTSNQISSWNDLNSNHKSDICAYYEYVQFKRAHFKCTNTKYNKQTGRIIKMEFKFNGKIE